MSEPQAEPSERGAAEGAFRDRARETGPALEAHYRFLLERRVPQGNRP